MAELCGRFSDLKGQLYLTGCVILGYQMKVSIVDFGSLENSLED